MYNTVNDPPDEHECPQPLDELVEHFGVGGMFLSPAGRWETITDLSPFSEYSARVEVHTDRTGRDYCWQFWKSQKLPYLPSWRVSRPRYVVVFESSSLLAEVTDSPRSFGHGYHLVSATQQRGAGWAIADCPDGKTVETVTVPNKARARTEVKRRAQAHAKRLGVPMWHPPAPAPTAAAKPAAVAA
jgi:hypothetical protein